MDFGKAYCNLEIQEQWFSQAESGRISHAQLLVSPQGAGALPFALGYAQKVFLSLDPTAGAKMKSLQHPDLFFCFPTASTEQITSDKVESQQFLSSFREFILENPYQELEDWISHIGLQKKQVSINVRDAQFLVKSLSLKSYLGGYKIAIIWMAEYLSEAASNKLLKMIEEPPEKTLFLLLTQDESKILQTIVSRCQTIELKSPSPKQVQEYLTHEFQIEPDLAHKISLESQRDFNLAAKKADNQIVSQGFEEKFIDWVRLAFVAKTKVSALQKLNQWSEEACLWPKEEQKRFLSYCMGVFREALVQNYGLKNISRNPILTEGFAWEKFVGYIDGANIEALLLELNQAHFHIERNANPKIVFLDTSIKMIRHLHMGGKV
ncbi:MAG: DNA polymerase III subunit delta' [Flavobacteriaceae bacterium]|nr:MAG: DNA polymerase III subunit delta' [Flavobacteriaceae bacterium]